MTSRTLLIATFVTLALILLQLGLLIVRNHVRTRLYPPAHAAPRRDQRLRASSMATAAHSRTDQES
jgi:hypothetical protein